MAAYGGIGLTFQADGFRQQPFKASPEMDAVEYGIQKIRDGAIMAVLRIGVMLRMVPGGLQNPDILEKRDDTAVLLARAMLPFMEFIGIGGKDGKQPDMPCEQTQAPGANHKQDGQQGQIP